MQDGNNSHLSSHQPHQHAGAAAAPTPGDAAADGGSPAADDPPDPRGHPEVSTTAVTAEASSGRREEEEEEEQKEEKQTAPPAPVSSSSSSSSSPATASALTSDARNNHHPHPQQPQQPSSSPVVVEKEEGTAAADPSPAPIPAAAVAVEENQLAEPSPAPVDAEASPPVSPESIPAVPGPQQDHPAAVIQTQQPQQPQQPQAPTGPAPPSSSAVSPALGNDAVEEHKASPSVVGAAAPPQAIPPPTPSIPEDAYFAKSVSEIETEFGTDREQGLKSSVIQERLQKYGVNALPKPSPPTKFEIFLGQFKDFLILLLIAVAILEFGLQEWPEGGVLLAVVLLNVIVGFNQEVKAQKALEALDSLTRNTCLVIRDGQTQEVQSRLIVPGDVVQLEEGDLIPADLRICEVNGIEIAEANLTGESVEITKVTEALPWNPEYPLPVADRKNMAFMSTVVVKGRAKGIVIGTGAETEVGNISSALAEKVQNESPLKRKLRYLGYYLVGLSTFLCGLVVGIGLIRIRADSGTVSGDNVEEMIKVGISLAVAVVPEGLVAVVTVTMALGVQRMAAKEAVMRNLPAVETLGSVTTICSDKTGTLTEGKMRLQYMWTPPLWRRAGPREKEAMEEQLRRMESRARLLEPMPRAAGPGLRSEEQRRKVSLADRGDSFMRGDSALLRRGDSTLRRGDSTLLRRGESGLRRGDSAAAGMRRGDSSFFRRVGSSLGLMSATPTGDEDGSSGAGGGGRVVSDDLVDVMNVTRNQSRIGRWFLDASMRQTSSLDSSTLQRSTSASSAAGGAAAALTGGGSGEAEDAAVLEMVSIDEQKSSESDSLPGFFSFSGKGINPDGDMMYAGEVVQELRESTVRAIMVASLNNTASLSFDLDTNQWEATGDSTEIPLEVAARKIGLGRENWLSSGAVSPLLMIPFDSDRQRMSVVYRWGAHGAGGGAAGGEGGEEAMLDGRSDALLAGAPLDPEAVAAPAPAAGAAAAAAGQEKKREGGVVLVKGSFDKVMVRCTHALLQDSAMPKHLHDAVQLAVGHEVPNELPVIQNAVQPLTEDLRQRIHREELTLTSQGLRVLTLAYRDVSEEELGGMTEHDPETVEVKLVFCGLVGIRDPPREEARRAIQRAHAGGIRVCMITGDHASTAMAIGESLGMITAEQQDLVVTGRELDQMTPEELQARHPFPLVFARVTPAHKLMIVTSLKAQGNVVAMTGDGVNDSPAIKHSDCGIAMGITGTDLTKQSADMVLLNDNFASIVDAIEEGRLTFDNIRKFVLYLLTCNSSYIYIMLVTVAAGLAAPFTPIMVLWANVVVDVLPALALGVDPPSPDIMDRKPRDPRSGVLSTKGVIMLFLQGVLMSGLTLAAYLIGLGPLDYPEVGKPDSELSGENIGQARTLAFASLAIQHVFQAYHARSPTRSLFNKDWNDNKLLAMGATVSLLLMVLAIYIPGVNDGLNLYPLEGWDWLVVFGVFVGQLLGNELIKLFLVRGLYSWLTKRAAETHGEPLFYMDI